MLIEKLKDNAFYVAIGGVLCTVFGLLLLVIISDTRFSRRCDDAGGRKYQREGGPVCLLPPWIEVNLDKPVEK